MLKINTAQYRVMVPDRLDITAKSKDPIGKVFAPSWDIIMGLKNSSITQDEYTEAYQKQMISSYTHNTEVWKSVAERESVTFICFCKPGDFCHRVLLVGYFCDLYGAIYKGELVTVSDNKFCAPH